MKKEQSIHFLKRLSDGALAGEVTACGLNVWLTDFAYTDKKKKVTCKNCKRIKKLN